MSGQGRDRHPDHPHLHGTTNYQAPAEELERAGFTIDDAASDAERKGVGETVIRYDPAHEDALRSPADRPAGRSGRIGPGQGPIFQVIVGTMGGDR